MFLRWTAQDATICPPSAIATLPSREELIAKLLGTMLNPIVGFARVLNGPVEAFARTVQAVADQKAAA